PCGGGGAMPDGCPAPRRASLSVNREVPRRGGFRNGSELDHRRPRVRLRAARYAAVCGARSSASSWASVVYCVMFSVSGSIEP
ncbi:hypothetical protein D2W72_12590, partial [Burkholderia pseudomallei]